MTEYINDKKQTIVIAQMNNFHLRGAYKKHGERLEVLKKRMIDPNLGTSPIFIKARAYEQAITTALDVEIQRRIQEGSYV